MTGVILEIYLDQAAPLLVMILDLLMGKVLVLRTRLVMGPQLEKRQVHPPWVPRARPGPLSFVPC